MLLNYRWVLQAFASHTTTGVWERGRISVSVSLTMCMSYKYIFYMKTIKCACSYMMVNLPSSLHIYAV